jgi:L-threonylcarbamoyladenylate synthase
MKTKRLVLDRKYTEKLNQDLEKSLDKELEEAALLIKTGQLVAFPTETVYGLGADALNAEACANIFKVKGRPSDNPLIVHVAELEEAKRLTGIWNAEAEICARSFWPGPLTLVLPKADLIPNIISGGLKTVAVRMPDHPVALSLIRMSGCPIAAPSANISGKPSPTDGEHVWQDLQGKIPLIIDAGKCKIGLESTVLDLSEEKPTILRPGGITKEQLEEVLGDVEMDRFFAEQSLVKVAPKAPGMKYRHYAPEGEVYLVQGETEQVLSAVKQGLSKFAGAEKKALLCMQETAEQLLEADRRKFDLIFVLGANTDRGRSARRVFEGLRLCDQQKMEIILVEGMSTEGIGLAFMNRLRKAAGKKFLIGKR